MFTNSMYESYIYRLFVVAQNEIQVRELCIKFGNKMPCEIQCPYPFYFVTYRISHFILRIRSTVWDSFTLFLTTDEKNTSYALVLYLMMVFFFVSFSLFRVSRTTLMLSLQEQQRHIQKFTTTYRFVFIASMQIDFVQKQLHTASVVLMIPIPNPFFLVAAYVLVTRFHASS